MKKVYLTFVGLCCVAQVSVFGQLYLRVETGAAFSVSQVSIYPYHNGAANYLNPQQLYYRNAQLLRFRIGRFFHAGIGLQQEWLRGCASCLRYKRPDGLQLTEIYYDYFIVEDSCEAALRAKEMLLSVPAELGFTFRGKKSPWAVFANTRLQTYAFTYRRVQLVGDSVNIQRSHHFRNTTRITRPKFFNWQASLGASYSLNKRVLLSADLNWSNYRTYQLLKSVGLNIGLDYALTARK